MHPALVLIFKNIGFYDTTEIFEIKRSAGTISFEFLEVVVSPNILAPEALTWCFEVNVRGRRPVFHSVIAVLEKNLPFGLGIDVTFERTWSTRIPESQVPVALPTREEMIQDLQAREQIFVDWYNDYRRQSFDSHTLYKVASRDVPGSGKGV